MPKRLAVAVILAAVLPMYGQEQSSHPNNNQHETSDAGSPPSNHALCVIKQDAITVECQWAEAKPQGYFERLIGPENAPNIALVIVGIGGICAAICTLRKIERQIQVAEADTQAMIRAERAWIVPSVKEIEAEVYVFSIKNEGKTPAKIISTYCVNSWTPRGNKLNIPPDESTADTLIQNPPILLPPGAEKPILRLERSTVQTISGGGPVEQSLFERGFGTAHTYGRIRYHDVLEGNSGTPHETRFLYLLIPQPGTIPIQDPFDREHNTYS